MTAKRIRRLLLPLAGPVPARTVRRYVAAQRAATTRKDAFVHRSMCPGTTMEVDFGESWVDIAGVPCKVKYLVATLPFSNAYVAKAYPLERTRPRGPRDVLRADPPRLPARVGETGSRPGGAGGRRRASPGVRTRGEGPRGVPRHADGKRERKAGGKTGEHPAADLAREPGPKQNSSNHQRPPSTRLSAGDG